MLNQKIHNYKIISLLGEGGMANVYLVEHEALGHRYALKLLKEEFVQHPNIRKRFLAEAKNLAKMQHPNVIKVTDLIDAGDIVAFVMEYVEGVSLEEYISQNAPLKNEIIESLFNQMINAVEYVHSQDLIHRDIKPSNFMVTPQGTVKLLDFGIAKNLNDGLVDYTRTSMAQQMGTPMYMSPEQVRNTTEITKQTDIYSLGVVLWQMVSGQKPYSSQTLSAFDLQLMIVQEVLTPTNTQWDLIIQKATAKKESERFESCEDFKLSFNNLSFFTANTDINLGDQPSSGKLRNGGFFNSLRILAILLLISLIFLLVFIFTKSISTMGENQVQTKTEEKALYFIENDELHIGDQIWMTKNLNVSTFQNGDVIPEAKTADDWVKAGENGQPAWCYYNNNVDLGETYGKLYNGHAVNDPRGLAPYGWHIPTDAEWTILEDQLGNDVGRKMKSTSGWIENGNGSNESGFSGLPGGRRYYNGRFNYFGIYGLWWSSSRLNIINLESRHLHFEKVILENYFEWLPCGLSVRCLKD
jgi:uncharacterized protein (TIGR02145 family)